jgi:TonB-linked SusC/RagA family outer membrane protein
MRNQFFYLILCLSFVLSGSIFAQNPSVSVSGKITDAQGEPMTGVSILEVGTNNGTTTGLDGSYRLTVAAGARIQYMYIGYKNIVRTATGERMDVTMEENVSDLDEVVVVAYGTQRKKDLTGAISVVDTKVIDKQLLPGIGLALQGLATGVHVTGSGTPGSDADIIIRGIGSFSDSSPLYVIDGMILESSQRQFNMHDVESVQILKDASATALYGARGANGVILITTKQGQAGPTQIRFNGSVGVSQFAKRYEMMNSLEFLRNQRLAYENADMMWPGEPQQGQELVNTDWQDAFYQTAITQDCDLSVSGGNSNGRYMMSFSLYDEDGVVIGPRHKRLTVRSNSEAKKGIFTIGENLMVGRSETKTMQGSLTELISMPPLIPVYDPDRPGEYGYGTAAYPTYNTNPVGMAETRDHRQYNFRVIGSAYLQIEPLKGLQIKSNVGIEYFNWYDNYKTTYKQLRYLTSNQYNNELHEGNGDMQSWLWENTAIYKNRIDKHEFDAMIGYTAQKSERRGNAISGYNMLNEGFWVLNQASPEEDFNVSGSRSAIAMTSMLGRINYNYDNRYLLQLNVRRDGSSLFGENYRFGVFPSASLGWRISEEQFMDSFRWVDDLKLRASYGVSGNQKAIPAYKYATYIVSGDRVGIFGDPSDVYPGLIQNGRANPDLRWEKRAAYNIGIDFSLFDQRLYGTIEGFHADLKDLLIEKDLPWISGTDINPWLNYGAIENKGVEFQIGFRETKADFKYDISLNLSTTSNKVLTLNGDDFYFEGAASYTEIGSSMGEFYVLRTDGIFQNWDEVYAHTKTVVNETTGQEESVLIQPNAAPGDIRYKDLSGDGAISEDDREFIGSPFPDLEGGVNFSCSYKNFDLNLFLFGMYGHLIYNGVKRTTEGMDATGNMSKNLTPWTGEGTSTTTPRPYFGPTDNTLAYTDRWVERGDYIRLKNLQIGYTFPVAMLKKTNVIEKLRIYAGAQNLFTLTGYSGLDPEISGGGLFSKGYDNGHFPPARMFNCGIQVSF